MSDRFWIGGTGNWNDTAHWSTSSGGASGASVPSSSDNAIFDANSNTTAYTVTINVAATCLDLNFSAAPSVSGTITWAGSSGMTISGNLTLLSGMTRTFTGTLLFNSTSGTKTLTCNSVTLASAITFNGVGGTWQCVDALNNGSSSITLTKGTWDTNGQTITMGSFSSSNSNTRALTLGASAITCSSAGGAWEITNSSGMTLTAGTSTITLSAGSPNFNGGGLTYYAVIFTGSSSSIPTINGANTFTNLTRTNSTNKNDGFRFSANQTVTGTFTVTGNSASNRIYVFSFTTGTQYTITAAAVSLTNVNFEDIVGAGAASWTGTSIGDCGNNSGITFDTPVNRYWVATSGGNWSATSSWASSSGGASGASVPLPQDTAFIDANSITSGGRTITWDMPRVGAVDATGVLNSPTLATSVTVTIYGNLNLGGCTPSGANTLICQKRSGTQTITCNGKTITWPLNFNNYGSTLQLSDALVSSSSITQTLSTFDANDQNVTCTAFTSANTNTRTLSLGSGTWTLTQATSTPWDTQTVTNLTFNAETSVIKFTGGAGTKTFFGGGLTFNTLWFAGTGTMFIRSNNTFATLKSNPGLTVVYANGSTQTITTLFDMVGTSGNLITMTSQTAGTAWNISKSSGKVCCDYLSLKDSAAAGGATWKAGSHSTDVSGNSGWSFTSCSTGSAPRSLMGYGI